MSAEDETAKMATEKFVEEYDNEHKIQPYSGTPKKDGVASAGDASTGFACGDHVHPTDTTRVAVGTFNTEIGNLLDLVNGKVDALEQGVRGNIVAFGNGSNKLEDTGKTVNDFFDNVAYDENSKKILFKNGDTVLKELSATQFIKDGMVSSVYISDGKLVISFNTDAGQEPIEIPLTDIFNPANYYDKTAADGKFVAKEAGKGLSTEDYTTAEQTKLGGIAVGAQVNVIEGVKVNGTALTPTNKVVDITLDDAVTRTSANGVKSSGIWSAIWGAASTAFTSLYDWCVAQLAGKASKADATLTERGFSKWTILRDGADVTEQVQQPYWSDDPDAAYVDEWVILGTYVQGDFGESTLTKEPNAVALSWYGISDSNIRHSYTATRTALQGYQLGSQTDKPLASEAEAEALRTDVAGKANRAANPTSGNLAALDASGNPTDSGVKASDKLDSTSAAPAFSTDSTVSYPVGSHCTYNGKLYVCTTATTGGTWVAGSWTAEDMTTPDAVLDITSQNQLRVVAKDGTLLWAQGYDLASSSSATLACDAVNNFTFADGATSQAFTLPTAPTGKVGDFGLDIDNSANTGAATMTLTGLDTTFSVVVPKGESLNDMLAIAAGELARFYISLSTFRVNNLPTWHIVKQVVENGGAQS